MARFSREHFTYRDEVRDTEHGPNLHARLFRSAETRRDGAGSAAALTSLLE